LVEVSGGMSLNNIQAMAKAGPHFISVGALTHSAPSMDLSMEIAGVAAKIRPHKRNFTI
jgi:nicotinate-nucleotide pyrophosphorylase (carboxylating)